MCDAWWFEGFKLTPLDSGTYNINSYKSGLIFTHLETSGRLQAGVHVSASGSFWVWQEHIEALTREHLIGDKRHHKEWER